MKHRYLAILLLLPTMGNANGFAQWGIASTTKETPDKSQIKFVEFGKSGEEGRLAYSIGIGGWVDHTHYGRQTTKPPPTAPGVIKIYLPDNPYANQEAQSSAFVEALFGIEPKSDHFYMSYKLGPAFITSPDAMLGSNIQLGHEFGFGMRDMRDVRVGFVLKHFSNAGLVPPNLGRDFIGLRIEW